MKKVFYKTMIMLLACMLALTFSIQPAKSLEPPSIEWSKTYGGTDEDVAHSVIQTPDGGYALAGETHIPVLPYGINTDAWLVKVDSSGKMQWNKTYGGTNSESLSSIVNTNGGGYAMAGSKIDRPSITNPGYYLSDFWLVKTDSSGNMEWNRTYHRSYYEDHEDFATCLIQTSDGGYVIAGYGFYSDMSHESAGYGWVVRTDSFGNMLWNTSDVWPYFIWGRLCSVVETFDGGYVTAGPLLYEDGSMSSRLTRIDSLGHVEWAKGYDAGVNYGARRDHSLVQTSDGGYAMAGELIDFVNPPAVFWLLKTDPSGNMQWNKTYGDGVAYSLVQTSNGGYMLAGSGFANLMETDSNGNLLWSVYYGGSAYSMVETSDRGYALAGSKDGDFWLVKTVGSIVFADGFESGSFGGWTSPWFSAGETTAVVNTIKHHGAYCARFTSNGGGGTEWAYCYETVSSSSEVFARGYFYVSQAAFRQDGSRFFFIIFRTPLDQLAFAGWRRIGGVVKWTLTTRNGTKYVDVFSSASLAKGRWYCVELHWKKDSAQGLAEMYVDGSLVCSSYGIDTAAYGDTRMVQFGLPQLMYCGSTRAYCDCAKIATAYIGPELATSKLTVTSPNGGESWVRGTTHPITWTSSWSVGSYVKIEALKSGVVKGTLTTANDGYYDWTIGSSHLGADYKIRITSTSNPACTDQSDNYFTITTGGAVGTITVTSPNGGESWKRGTTHPITWVSSGSVGANVKIELLKSGVVKGTLTTANDGSYSWTIGTSHLGTDYKIRITSTSNPAITDSSNSDFAITT